MAKPLVFRSGPVSSQVPLGRYLPRLPQGAAAAWLRENIPAGSWVIDPFGASPQLAIEAAQAGYRILVAAHNPVSRFILEMTATPSSADEMRSALAALAASRRGDERLEPHIRALYATNCERCGQEISAKAFVWEREAEAPYARIYACPHCEQEGEFPTTERDKEKAAGFTTSGMHRARALERIARSGDPNREHAEEALDAYLPRAVYALFTIINRLDGLSVTDAQRDMLSAMMLTAFDRGNTLWHVSGSRPRPRQLTIPTVFYENNIWLALEEAINIWASSATATPLTYWPKQPLEEGGVCIFEGRMRELADELGGIRFQAVVSALPRPNQAFWTLSALWAGWLWGREAVAPFVNVLRRRRYDWAWHTSALESSLSALAPLLSQKTPFFGLITENEAGFDGAALMAADLAWFKLQGIALRMRSRQTQFLWQRRTKPPTLADQDPAETIKTAMHTLLAKRGEPAPYLLLQAASMYVLAQNGQLSNPKLPPAENYTDIRNKIEEALTYKNGYLRYGHSEHSIEVGQWWPRQPGEVKRPLADRVEKAVVNFLLDNPKTTFNEIDAHVCRSFKGLRTPGEELITIILNSYAQEDENGCWSIKENDTAQERRADVEEMNSILTGIGKGLGYTVTEDPLLTWQDPESEDHMHFHIIASAVLGKIIFAPDQSPGHHFIVLPGSRSRLIDYKLERDPRLAQEIESGWRLLKFRLVRRMGETPGLTRENLFSHFDLDPITVDDPQMPLL